MASDKFDQEREIIGKNIRSARTEAKMSLRDLANFLPISHTMLGKIENGKASASQQILKIIGSVLKLPVDYFKIEQTDQKKLLRDIDEILSNGGKLDVAEKLVKDLLNSTTKTNKPIALNYYGKILFSKGRYREAFEKWEEMFGYSSKNKDHSHLIIAVKCMAICKYYLKEYGESINYIHMALDLNPEEDVIAELKQLKANIFAENNDLEKAITIHEELLAYYKGVEQAIHSVVQTMHSIADIKLRQGNRCAAKETYQHALEMSYDNFYKLGIAHTGHELAILYFQDGDPNRADEIASKALLMTESSVHITHVARLYLLLAKCANDLVEKEKFLKSSISLIDDSGEYDLVGDIHFELARINDEKGDMSESLKYYRIATEFYQRAIRG